MDVYAGMPQGMLELGTVYMHNMHVADRRYRYPYEDPSPLPPQPTVDIGIGVERAYLYGHPEIGKIEWLALSGGGVKEVRVEDEIEDFVSKVREVCGEGDHQVPGMGWYYRPINYQALRQHVRNALAEGWGFALQTEAGAIFVIKSIDPFSTATEAVELVLRAVPNIGEVNKLREAAMKMARQIWGAKTYSAINVPKCRPDLTEDKIRERMEADGWEVCSQVGIKQL